MDILLFFTNNWEAILGVITALFGALKLSNWGKAKSQALDAVVSVVEAVGSTEVKRALKVRPISAGASDALEHAVSKVDVKKEPKRLGARLATELLRGIVPRS